MRILLDTNALLWAYVEPRLLSSLAAEAIADPTNSILVSAASAWEIGTKVRIGKLPMAASLEEDFVAHIGQAGFALISIDIQRSR